MSIEALKEEARGHEQREDWADALQLYLQAIARMGDDDPDMSLYNRAGDLFIRVGDQESAIEYYERAVDLYLEAELANNAIAILKKVLRNNAARNEVYLKMGQIRAKQGFLTDARAYFVDYAERMQKTGDLEEAFRALRELCELAPDDLEIRFSLASQLQAHDQQAEALGLLTSAYHRFNGMGQLDLAQQVEERIRDIDSTYEMPEADAEDLLGFESTSLAAEEISEVASNGLEISGNLGEIHYGDDQIEDVEEIGTADEPETSRDGLEDMQSLDDFDIGGDPELQDDLGGGLELNDDLVGAFEQPPVDDGTAGLSAADFGVSDDGGRGSQMYVDPSQDVTEVEGEVGDVLGSIDDDAVEVWGAGTAWSDGDQEEEVDQLPTDLPLIDFGPSDGLAADAAVVDEDDGRWREDESPSGLALQGATEADDALAGVELEDWGDAGLDEILEAGEAGTGAIESAETTDQGDAKTEAPDDWGDSELIGVGPAAEIADLPHTDDLDLPQGQWGTDLDDPDAWDGTGEPYDDDEGLPAPWDEVVPAAEELAQATEELAPADPELTPALDMDLPLAEVTLTEVTPQDDEPPEVADGGNREGIEGFGDGAVETADPTTEGEDTEYVDLGTMILGVPQEKTTRWNVEAEEPETADDFDFQEMLAQFKAKVAENVEVSDARAHYDLGTAFKEMGLLDEAISEFQQALRADGRSLATYEVLGQCFMEKGQPEVAVASLTMATELPFEVEDELLGIYYYLGRAHEKLGNRKKAVEFYEKVFALDINFQDVTERLRELR